MNVTSMLSSGYLQPSRGSLSFAERSSGAAAMSAQEQSVLAQEKSLKAASGADAEVSTTYTYATGPDGRRYITGAVVSVKSETAPGSPGGEKVKLDGNAGPAKKDEQDDKKTSSAKSEEDSKKDPEVEAEVSELKRIEREVVAHEAAHKAAGGGLTGAVSYSYTKGPDGKNYITGGEVPISMPSSSGDPAETIRSMTQVQRAALAPASPSGQDLSVASQAAAIAANARQELAAQNSEALTGGKEANGKEAVGMENSGFSSGVSSVKAGLLFERLHGEESPSKESPSKTSDDGYALSIVEKFSDRPERAAAANPAEVYERSASEHGLWTLARGFEPQQQAEQTKKPEALQPAFSIAA